MGAGFSLALRGLMSAVIPDTCAICSSPLAKGEKLLCFECRMEMPLTGIASDGFTPIHERIVGHVEVDRAASFFYYHRGAPFTRLIHKAKYYRQPWIIASLAEDFAARLVKKGFFDGMDVILPVPMHWWKRWRRGYNPTAVMAEAISAVSGVAEGDNLYCRRGHKSQTRRAPGERALNVSDVFDVRCPHELDGLHILVVDDIITTGSTMLSCCEAIGRRCRPASVSVLSLGLAGDC